MSPTPSPLQEFLLTRADLTRLAVAAADIDAWLQDGQLQLVGELSGAVAPEPVFAVAAPALCNELSRSLATIGKRAVALSPQRLHAFLMRVCSAAAKAGPTTGSSVDAPPPTLTALLTEALASPPPDASLLQSVIDDELERELTASMDTPEGCFDATDLTAQMDNWDVPAAMATTAGPTAAAAEPEATPIATAEPVSDPIPIEDPAPPTAVGPDSVEVTAAAPTTLAPESAAAQQPAPEPQSAATVQPTPEPQPAATVQAAPEPQPTAAVAEVAATAPTTAAAPTATSPADSSPPAAPFAQTAAMLASTSQSMQRLEGFLGRLQSALVDLANRPQPGPVDTAPLLQAVHAELEAAAVRVDAKVDAIRTDTQTAIGSLSNQVHQLGDRVEQRVQQGVDQALTKRIEPTAVAQTPATEFVVGRRDRRPLVLTGIGVLIVAWSALFWFKTGSPRLAIGTLVSANLVACCLLLSWRRN